jgi:hypothetical protein
VLERAELEARVEALRAAQRRAREEAAAPLAVDEPERPEGTLRLSGALEAFALGLDAGLERYAVVELPEGELVYASRGRTRTSASEPASETSLTQRVARGRLQEFSLEVRRGPSTWSVRGRRVGGQLRIERRLDGFHIATDSIPTRVAFVDAGTGVAALPLAHTVAPGSFEVLAFEDLEPVLLRLELVAREDGVLFVRSGAGPWAASVRPDGSLAQVDRTEGSGVVQWRALGDPDPAQPGVPVAARAGQRDGEDR